MKYKSLKSQPEHKENPFVEEAIKDIKIVTKTQVVKSRDKREIQMIVSDGGEVQGYSQFLRFVEVDETQFAKVYLSQFSAFWELSKPAIRVFGYILTVLKPDQDRFYFDMETCLEYTKYTQTNNIMTGLTNLIECGIIARSTRHWIYYINPLVMFNGDRVTFAKTFIKKKQGNNPNQMNLFGSEELL